MTNLAYENLPESLKTLHSRPLFVMQLDVHWLSLTDPPWGFHRISAFRGGSFQGNRISGEVLGVGSDWESVRSDGSITFDARLVLKTRDDAFIAMSFRGIRYASAGVLERLEAGDDVDPGSYYCRINPLFETTSPKYDWINRLVGVGIGARQNSIFSIFEVL